MKRSVLEGLVGDGMSIREIANTLGRSYSGVRYWIRKYDLSTRYSCTASQSKDLVRSCRTCNGEFESNRRLRCPSCDTKVRRIRNKLAAIQLLGSKCCSCGLEADLSNFSAFEFHHRNPDNKDLVIGKVANKSWDIVKGELVKCDLLCSNCHRMEHSDRQGDILVEVLGYEGPNKEISLLLDGFR